MILRLLMNWGNPIFIEVKTTTSGEGTPFYISSNEVAFSKVKEENFFLYRVYDFNPEIGVGQLYIAKGCVEQEFTLVPTEYRASL